MQKIHRHLCLSVVAALLPPMATADAASATGVSPPDSVALAVSPTPSSEHLERGLQTLNWDQFKSVVNAIPKLKADVDAYGPMGWQYVRNNYRTYRWRKNIDKLNSTQKSELAKLISTAQRGQER